MVGFEELVGDFNYRSVYIKVVIFFFIIEEYLRVRKARALGKTDLPKRLRNRVKDAEAAKARDYQNGELKQIPPVSMDPSDI